MPINEITPSNLKWKNINIGVANLALTHELPTLSMYSTARAISSVRELVRWTESGYIFLIFLRIRLRLIYLEPRNRWHLATT